MLAVCQPSRLAAGAEPPCVLIPGAGLGRLCLDIARLGFRAEVGWVPASALCFLPLELQTPSLTLMLVSSWQCPLCIHLATYNAFLQPCTSALR